LPSEHGLKTTRTGAGRCHLLKYAIPVLPASRSAAAEEFYGNRLGFRRQFASRLDETKPGPGYEATGSLAADPAGAGHDGPREWADWEVT
jgi:hypothetical protein